MKSFSIKHKHHNNFRFYEKDKKNFPSPSMLRRIIFPARGKCPENALLAVGKIHYHKDDDEVKFSPQDRKTICTKLVLSA